MPDRAAVSRKAIVIIAGPNGAGKTTFALAYLRIEAMALNSSMPISSRAAWYLSDPAMSTSKRAG